MRLLRGGRSAAPEDDPASRFRALFDDNHRALLAYALRRTSSSSDAADVLAETMLVAWRRIDDVPNGDGARPWLYGVARKVLGNQRRAEGRRSSLAQRLAMELGDEVVRSGDAVPDQLWIRAALEALDDTDREVLTLTAWEELSPSETAAVLGIPAATVRTRLHRARARLRAQLEATSHERSATYGHGFSDEQPRVLDHEEVR